LRCAPPAAACLQAEAGRGRGRQRQRQAERQAGRPRPRQGRQGSRISCTLVRGSFCFKIGERREERGGRSWGAAYAPVGRGLGLGKKRSNEGGHQPLKGLEYSLSFVFFPPWVPGSSRDGAATHVLERSERAASRIRALSPLEVRSSCRCLPAGRGGQRQRQAEAEAGREAGRQTEAAAGQARFKNFLHTRPRVFLLQNW
jgi:hypothetical protein